MKKKTLSKKKPSIPPMALSLEGTRATKTGTWRYLTPAYQNKVAPCNEGCPAGEDIEAAMVLSGQEDYLGAWEKITRENPLPRVCGRVCFHPCERACNRREFDEPAAINALERFVGDRAFQAGKALCPGSAEKERKSGGHRLRAGRPFLRLPFGLPRIRGDPVRSRSRARRNAPLRNPRLSAAPRSSGPGDSEILSLGVEARPRTRVGADLKWEDLKDFDAVFISAGAWKSLPLGIPGENAAGVMSGLEFLKKVNSGETVDLGERVAIVGGGNTAMDAARSALRLGAKPLILYRRTKEEMPAWEEEISEAEEEAIEFLFLSSPVRVLTADGKSQRNRMRQEYSRPSGKRRAPGAPPHRGSNFTLPVDSILSCIGETPDFSFLPEN